MKYERIRFRRADLLYSIEHEGGEGEASACVRACVRACAVRPRVRVPVRVCETNFRNINKRGVWWWGMPYTGGDGRIRARCRIREGVIYNKHTHVRIIAYIGAWKLIYTRTHMRMRTPSCEPFIVDELYSID